MVRADDITAIWDEELASIPAWSLVLRTRDLEVDVRGDLAYSGASTIKTFLLEQASLTLAWDQPVTVTPEHVAVGDGVLAHWPLPVTLPLHAVAQLMAAISDNTATNVVVDVLGGLEVVNDALADAGLTSRMRRWVTGRHSDPRCDDWDSSPSLPSRAGLSVVVPSEHAVVIDRLVSDPRHAVARAMLEQSLHFDSPGPAPPRRHAVRAQGRVGRRRTSRRWRAAPRHRRRADGALLHRRTRAGRVAGRPGVRGDGPGDGADPRPRRAGGAWSSPSDLAVAVGLGLGAVLARGRAEPALGVLRRVHVDPVATVR